MIIRKLGKEWGVAYAEAQPIEVSYFDAQFEAFITEGHELKVILPPGAVIEWTSKGFEVTIPSS